MKKLCTILLLIIGVNATEDNTLNMSIEAYDKLMLHKVEIALNDFMDAHDFTLTKKSRYGYKFAIAQLKFDKVCNRWDLLTKESKEYLLNKYKHKNLEKVYAFPEYCHVKIYPDGDRDKWGIGHFYRNN